MKKYQKTLLKFAIFILLFYISMIITITALIYFINLKQIKFNFILFNLKYLKIESFFFLIILFFIFLFTLAYKYNKELLLNKNKNKGSKFENKNKVLKSISKKHKLKQSTSGFSINYKLNNNQLTFNTLNQHHLLVIGTSGIGKSQSIVLPNIISNLFSLDKPNLIIFDPKGELYNLTKDYAKISKYQLVDIDFINFKGSCWNPFDKLNYYWNENKIDLYEKELETIVSNIIVNIKTDKDPVWHKSALILLKGHITALMLSFKKPNLNFSLIINSFCIGIDKLVKGFENILLTSYDSLIKISLFKKYIAMFIGKKNNMLPSIYLIALTSLDKYTNQLFYKKSLTTDFNLNDKKPKIIFIKTSPINANYWTLARLFITLYLDYFTLNNKNNIKSLFLLDEFASIPKIHNFLNIISVARGYNIFFMLIVQSYSQLEKYKGYNNIIANINYSIYLHSNDLNTVKYFSELLGKKNIIKPNNINNLNQINYQYQSKELITPYNLMMLDKNYFILKASHCNPIKIKTLYFYNFYNKIMIK